MYKIQKNCYTFSWEEELINIKCRKTAEKAGCCHLAENSMWEEMMQGEKICYVKPRRAIRRLKAADEENITAYIYGVSGCGKTELVMRYLKNRKYTLFNAGLVTVEELA